MYIYKIENNTGVKCIITDNPVEIAELTSDGHYPSETPIVWAGDGAKRLTDDWVLEDIPVEPAPEPILPTADQVKQQKYAEINMMYSVKLRQISNARVLAENQGLPTDALVAKYKSLQEEQKVKILEAYNS